MAAAGWMPVPLLCRQPAGYWGTAANPFNPLQLQNAATFVPQLWNIALYYAVLLPFFFLTGFTISLVFVAERRPRQPGVRVRPDGGRGGGGAGAWADAGAASVRTGAGAAGAAGGQHAGRRRAMARWWPRRLLALMGSEAALLLDEPGERTTTSRRSTRRCTCRMRGRWRRCGRRAASMRCWTTSPSGWTSTCRTMRACWACRWATGGVRAVSGWIADRGAAGCGRGWWHRMRRRRSMRCRMCVAARRAGAAGRRLRRVPGRAGAAARRGRGMWTRWSRTRCCGSAIAGLGSGRLPLAMPPMRGRAPAGATRPLAVARAGRAVRPRGHQRPTSWTRARRMRSPTRPRRWRPIWPR